MGFSGFYVFGDSLVDAGNALKLAKLYDSLPFSDFPDGAPSADLGYYAGRFSNGFTFADLVSNKTIGTATKPTFPYGYDDPWLGVPIDPFASAPSGNNLNWAYGGAQIRQGQEVVPDLDGQTDAFRHAVNGHADPNALYLITMGGNDVRSLVPSGGDFVSQVDATNALTRAAGRFNEEVGQLIDIGVRHIVVTGVPDVGLIPRYDVNGDGVLTGDELARSQQATLYSEQLDAMIQQQLDQLRIDYPTADIRYVSLTQAIDENLASLEALYGRPLDPTADADLLFFDQIHPTAQSHALLASSIIDAMNGVEHTANEQLPLTAPDYAATGLIGVKGEVDSIVISLAANTSYTFEMLGISALGGGASVLEDPSLKLLGPRGKVLGTNDDGGLGLDSSLAFTTGGAGDYTIKLTGVGSMTGTYTFQASGAALGNDTYVVTHANAVILERAGEGIDVARATLSYALAAGTSIETLRTNNNAGTAAIDLTGNEVAQKIVGNAGSNAIDGKGGDDTLTGGAGADTFAFTTALRTGNVDKITDFSVVDDSIVLDHGVFAGLAAGTLASGAFAVGSVASEADDRVIYDPATGNLWFDSDGAGGADAVLFATVGSGRAMTASDLIVV
jgi:phospholipase/lecithinase/hemolysin